MLRSVCIFFAALTLGCGSTSADAAPHDAATDGAGGDDGTIDGAGDAPADALTDAAEEDGSELPPNPDNPKLGELYISEVMVAGPNFGLAVDFGEYVEVFNAGTRTIDLDGCVIESGAGQGAEASKIGPSVIAAGSHAVLRVAAPDIVFDYTPLTTYGGVVFDDTLPDWVAIHCGDDDLDGVGWNGSMDFPSIGSVGSHAARERSRSAASGPASAGTTWCNGKQAHTLTRTITGASDSFSGTPGEANDCP